MKLEKISIDLSILLDPYKLAIILSGLDKYYSEIFVPEGYQILQIERFLGYPYAIEPLTEQLSFDEYKEHGFLTKNISNNNFIAGLQLFQKAANHGMISFLKSGLDFYTVREFVGTSHFFTASVDITNDIGGAIGIYPDRGGILEEMLYYDITENIKPIYGDTLFAGFLDRNMLLENIKTDKNIERNKDFETFLRCPQSLSIEQLFDYIKNLNLIETFNYKVENQHDKEKKKQDLAILFVEFLATLALDSLAFGGYPISSGAVLTYKGIERIRKGKSESK